MGGKLLGFTDNELSSVFTSNQDRAWRSHQKPTKREKFLTKMEVMMPCQALIDLIKPQYPGKQERRHAFLSAGHDAEAPSSGTVVFLRDPVKEEVLIEVPTMLHFAGTD